MYNKLAPEAPTTDRFMDTIISRQPCGKHGAAKDFPCWILESSAGFLLQGVCNKRASRAGFNHRISDKSLRLFRTASPKR